MKTKRLVSVLFAGLVCWLSAAPAQALMTYFEPTARSVLVGQTFSVNLFMSVTPNEPAVLGWDFDLIFDPTQMSWEGTNINTALWFDVPSNNVADPVGLAALAFPDPISGPDVLLAEILFRCIAEGSSLINVGLITNDFGQQGIQLDAAGLPSLITDWDAQGAVIRQTTQIPEPGSLLLLAIGLAGGGLAMRLRPRSR